MPKTEQEKAEIRRQTEARRQAGKDRTGHERRRGKKMTLKALSSELPNEDELKNFADILAGESDRSAAIMATSYLEMALFHMLNANLPDWGPETQKEWFDGATAPFRSFSSKIILGQALGIYGVLTTQRLNAIRNIRNAFAHRVLPLGFDHPTIVSACKDLVEKEFLPGASQPAKTRFCALCLRLGRDFLIDAVQQGGKEITTRFP